MTPSATLENMNWRYAVKKYDPSKKLSAEQVNLVKESLRLAPSSFGLEAWNFIHVTNPETRAKLREVGFGQPQITDASELFVLAPKISIDEKYVDEFVASVAASRNVPVESLAMYAQMLKQNVIARPAEDLKIWLAHQIYIPLGVAIANLANNHIDASPMEGFDAAKFDEILGLDTLGLHAQVILAVGFRADDDTYASIPKFRNPAEKVFIER
jgi:nitroreductase